MRVDIILPVYNEERRLERGVNKLYQFLKRDFPIPWRIIIANNGSTDNTLNIVQSLCLQFPEIEFIHLEEKGRGRALRQAMLSSDADFVGYMDIDISTDLNAFPQLIQALIEGADIAIGSRHLPSSKVIRSLKRGFFSRGYNLLLKALFSVNIKDAQCGFKALRRAAAQQLLPLVRDNGWFFDTELLILAQKRGYHIKEIPVSWVEDKDSKVNILKTVAEDIKGLIGLFFRLRRGDG